MSACLRTECASSDITCNTAAAILLITKLSVPDSSTTVATKLTFQTAATYQGDMGGAPTGISRADMNCMGDANKPAGGSTYKALIVDTGTRRACTTANCSGGTSEHTDWVLAPNTTYLQSDGATVIMTTNASGIFEFGTLSNPFGTGGNYWNGMNGTWTTGATCVNWGGTAGTCAVGNSTATGVTAIANGAPGGTTSLTLICIEQ